MDRPNIGLLPLYLELYDRVLPQLRAQVIPLADAVCAAFEQRGIAVTGAGVCCTREHIADALAKFDRNGVHLIVTLHLAYSPSLEAAEPLVAAPQPILMLDTTLDAAFGRNVDPVRLLLNHGIHGVQDLAAVLRRHRKPYEVVAGHMSDPRVMAFAEGRARAAWAAALLRRMQALSIGGPLEGMGDFVVAPATLERTLGIRCDTIGPEALGAAVESISKEAIETEQELDTQHYRLEIDPEVHRRSLRIGLGLRRYLEEGGYGAFSMNFDAFQSGTPPIDTVPFLECSKAMARGIGYAGEGDVLTASLMGVLQRAFGMTSFTEMFCPDWAGNSIFLSHMAEFNPELAAAKPLLYEKDYTLSAARNPAALALAPKPGPGTLVNLAPGADDTFRLIVSPVEVLEDGTHPGIDRWVRGWIRPPIPVADFLASYSQLGGTHHSVLMLGQHMDAVSAFGRMTGMEVCQLGATNARGDTACS
jgi:L-arabinose isomerase